MLSRSRQNAIGKVNAARPQPLSCPVSRRMPTPVTAPTTTPGALDDLGALPPRNQRSIVIALAVQALNAFNDNFVKMLIIAFAGAVAHGTDLGDSMQVYLGAIFALPYVLFAPLAGWLSDRYSKQRVIFWMQVLQVIVFITFIAALWLRQPMLTLSLCLLSFFLLASQAAFFSPAKMGIIKELVGLRRLGSVNGILQMTMFIGILSGMWAGGTWFGTRIAELKDPWVAVWVPMLAVSGLAVLQILGALAILRTPDHPQTKFEKGVFLEHFKHLKLVFSRRPLKLAAIGITYFWFMSACVGAILVTLSHEMHEGDAAGASKALSLMAAMLGVGVVSGSIIASLVCRRRVDLGVVPVAGLGLALSTLWAGMAPHEGSSVFGAMVGIGLFGGAFMTPLYAFIQSRSPADELARILSAVNLMDCLGTIVGNIVVVKIMLLMKVPASWQLILLSPLALIAAGVMTRLLSNDLARFISLYIIRTVYKVRPIHAERLPATGGVLVLSNHISYVDAFILGAACNRKTRFVMWDVLYNVKAMQWFFRIVGTVPISTTRAKDAILAVATALKAGEVVCLFPEGQITRHGMINDLRKGFELMARKADVPVLPVYMDGLYGSIFSFEGGKFFKKWPRGLRYPVSVHFGTPIPARQGTADAVRNQMYELANEALLSRSDFDEAGDDPAKQRNIANALRLMEIEWARQGDTLLCLEPAGSVIHQTLLVYAQLKSDVHLRMGMEALEACGPGNVIAIGSAASCARVVDLGAWRDVGKFVMCWDSVEAAPPEVSTELYRGLMDAATGILYASCVPDPEMPENEAGGQLGTRADALGRLLPGFKVTHTAEALIITGLAPVIPASITLPGIVLDDFGFLKKKEEVGAESPQADLSK